MRKLRSTWKPNKKVDLISGCGSIRTYPLFTICLPARNDSAFVRQRVQFKITGLVHDLLPAYLAEDCQLVSVTGHRQLRSSDTDTCLVQRTNTRFGDRTFTVAGPRVWNSLPTQCGQTLHSDNFDEHSKRICLVADSCIAPSDSVFRALCINWLTYLLTNNELCS